MTDRVLVTGGSGFIGHYVIHKLLRKKYEVNCLDVWNHVTSLANFIEGTVTDISIVEQAMKGCNYIIHLAAILGTDQSLYNASEVMNVNVVGTANVLTVARKLNVKQIVFPSTPDVPWLNPYKISKRTCENLVRIYRKYFNQKIVMFRLRNAYGPYERCYNFQLDAPFIYQKAVPTFITKSLDGDSLPIFGSGEQKSDYIYVDDVAEAFIQALTSEEAVKYDYIPLGTGVTTSVIKLAVLIKQLIGSSSNLLFCPPRNSEVETVVTTDTSILKKALDFQAKTSLKEGLKQTIEWFKEMGYAQLRATHP